MSSQGVKKAKTSKRSSPKDELWIAPSHSLKWAAPKVGWELRPGESSPSSRFLELSDIALGAKRPEPKKVKAAGAGAHVTAKKSPDLSP